MNPRVHCLCNFWLVLLIQNTRISCQNRTKSNTNLSWISAHENWLTFYSSTATAFWNIFGCIIKSRIFLWIQNLWKFQWKQRFAVLSVVTSNWFQFPSRWNHFQVRLHYVAWHQLPHHVQATSSTKRVCRAKIFHEAIKTPASKLLSLLDATIFQESLSKADLESLFWREFLLLTENQLLTARLRTLDYVFIYASYHPPTLLT